MTEHCEWKRIASEGDKGGMYLTSCGEVTLLSGVPVDEQSCPYCQRLVKVTQEVHQ